MCCSHKLAFVNIFTWYIAVLAFTPYEASFSLFMNANDQESSLSDSVVLRKKVSKQAKSNYIVSFFFMVDYHCIYMALYNKSI